MSANEPFNPVPEYDRKVFSLDPLTMQIANGMGEEAQRSITELAGKVWAVIGVNPRGDASHRLPRTKSLQEIFATVSRAQHLIDMDTGAAEAQNRYRIAQGFHEVAVQDHTAVKIQILGERARLRDAGKDDTGIERELKAHVGAIPSAPAPVELQGINTLEYLWVAGDMTSMYMRTMGYPRHGGPYQRRWEVAWEEIQIAAGMVAPPPGERQEKALSTGNDDPDQGRFQPRRAATNLDTMLDVVVLRTLDRRQVNPYFTLRDSMESVRSDLYAHVSDDYEQWLGYVRGMIAERNRLFKEYSPAKNNPFGVTIPKDRAYETLARKLMPEDYSSPGGPTSGTVISKVRQAFGENLVPFDAIKMNLLIHGVQDPTPVPPGGGFLSGLLAGIRGEDTGRGGRR